MKKIKILLIAILTLCFVDNIKAQSHNSNVPNSGCKYANNGKNYEKEGFIVCNACRNDEEKKRIAKQAEDKRQYELDKAKTKALQEANQKAFDENQKRKQEEIKGGQSGEVLINGSSDNSKTQTTSNTTTKPLDNYDPNTGLYANPMTNTNSGSTVLDSYNKGQQKGQQIADVTIGIVDLFSPSPETLKRREAEAKEEARNRANSEGSFKSLLNKNLRAANNGDENARMILISQYRLYRSWQRDFSYLLPDAENWIVAAVANKNLDAMCMVGDYIYADKNSVFTNKTAYGVKSHADIIKTLEEAANLGSTDAMVFLGNYYNQEYGGNDAEKAFYWYTRAAENNSPNAMFYLGEIYRYGEVGGNATVKYKIKKDYTIAHNWFIKSASNPDYQESLFNKGGHKGSYFTKYSYRELSMMYEKGKGCEKNKEIAKKFWNMMLSSASVY